MQAVHQEPAAGGRRGFVLAFVVMMLFAISVAGATGYLVVSGEFTVAKYSKQGAEALAIARAGMQRFVAQQIGVVGDGVVYDFGNGSATITTRYLTQLSPLDSLTDVYYIRSEGRVSDALSVDIPAVRVVGGYALHHRRPLAHHATLVLTSQGIDLSNDDYIWARDESTVADCPGGDADEITGVVTLNDTRGKGEDITGNPRTEKWGTFDAVYDSIGLRWDVLTDPNFKVDFEGPNPPDWSKVPSDSFPVVRYDGSNTFDGTWSGQGVLIVTGTFRSTGAFRWQGIVLAGQVASGSTPSEPLQGFTDGMFVGGLNGENPQPSGGIDWKNTVEYWSCYVYAANESLSYLELLPNTVYEVN